VLRLLIDTSAWLDLAMRRDGQKWIVPLRVFLHQGKLELLVPPLIIEEFQHNRPRSEAAVTKSVLARLRQLRRELHDFAGEKHAHVWLEETEQHIPLVNAMAPQNFREIAELLSKGTKLKPTSADRARMIQRGLEKKAPFSAGKNSVADALLIEMYATQLKKADPDDVYCFVTSNHRDFSAPNGDYRQPHPGLAAIFSSPQSRYLYQVEGLHAGLLDYFGDEFAEEYQRIFVRAHGQLVSKWRTGTAATPSGGPSAPITRRHGSTATSAGSWPPCAGCLAVSGTSLTHRRHFRGRCRSKVRSMLVQARC
jgi:PIN domain